MLLLGLGFLYACIANIVTWSLGANRVAAVAAEEGVLPEALGRLHPRFRTPHVAFVVMGFVVDGSSRRQRPSLRQPVQRLLDDVQAHRRSACFSVTCSSSRPSSFFGGASPTSRARIASREATLGRGSHAIVCTLYIAGASALFFAPSPTSQAPLKEGIILGVETLATIVVGYLLIPRGRRARAAAAASRAGTRSRSSAPGPPAACCTDARRALRF